MHQLQPPLTHHCPGELTMAWACHTQALLDASASIDLSDTSGLTALHAAAKSGHFGAVQCLIDAAANVARHACVAGECWGMVDEGDGISDDWWVIHSG